ncbi:MAG: TolC family protein [Nitrospinota bacterium]
MRMQGGIGVFKAAGSGALAGVLLAGCASAFSSGAYPAGGNGPPEGPRRARPAAVRKSAERPAVKRAAPPRATGSGAAVLRLPELIKEALAKNPGVRALRERWAAARARIPAASSLDDPVFRYTNFIQRVETRVGPQRNRFDLSQKFPFFGKLALREEIASRKASEAGKFYEARKVDLVAWVKSTYYGLFLVHKAIGITEKNLGILRRLARVANLKYATGKASQQDVLKAEVRLSRLANALITLQQEKKTAEAALNTLLNRPPDAPLGRPAEIRKRKFKARAEDLQRIAQKRHPLLLALQEAIRKNAAALALAKRQYYPDFTVGLGYVDVGGGTTPGSRDGKDAVTATLGINIPLWFERRKADAEAARAAVRASRARYEATRNKILFDIQNALTKVRTAERLVDLFTHTLIPQAEQSFKASLIGYEADKVDFLNLLDSQKVLQDLQLERYRVMVDLEQRLADLERAVGVELGRL